MWKSRRFIRCSSAAGRAGSSSSPKCGEEKVVYYGCNSRICAHCGKSFTDKWADIESKKAEPLEKNGETVTHWGWKFWIVGVSITGG
jgi:hypothetical protein